MLRKLVTDELIELIFCSCRTSECLGNQCVSRSHRLLCAGLCKCGSCENESEDTCHGVFDKNEDEVEITENGLEYENEYSDNNWTINKDCLV